MRRLAILFGLVVAGCRCSYALDPSLDIGQYGHDAWTVRSGFIKGNIYTLAQTPDGYLWLGTEFGLFRFDGVRSAAWQPPAGQLLSSVFRLLATRDGSLWIGGFDGLWTWSAGKLTRRPELRAQVVGSLIEDREGTVWAGSWKGGPPPGRLCAIRDGAAQCYGEDGVFGAAVSSLYEDSSGTLWAGTQAGLWRWKPGTPTRYAIPSVELSALTEAGDRRLLAAEYGTGLLQLAGGKVEPYPIRAANSPSKLLRDREVDSNKLLRDRHGGLWIGTAERGLIHVHQGRTDVFSQSDGLSGSVVLSLFEDREGNVWVSTTGGLDRFRDLSVRTISSKQGLHSDASHSVLATTDGSIWIGAHDSFVGWKNGQLAIVGNARGPADLGAESLYQDGGGRIWAFTERGLAFLKDDSLVIATALTRARVAFMTGDKAGNLWASENHNLLQFREGRLVDQIPWSELGYSESASVLLSDTGSGGLWLGFYQGGGVSYFQDHRVRASYTAAGGLGRGAVSDLKLDREGALWVATEDGGVSRLKDGRIATLTSSNGLPCDSIHWTMEDDDRSLWLYSACGLVRITRSELEAWIAAPRRRVEVVVLDAGDGVRLRANSGSRYGPRVAKSTDGKFWFVTGEGIQVFDPHHLAHNEVRPPVHIEQISADQKSYWRNLTGAPVSTLRLPARVRDLQIDYTSLSLVAPEKVHFKYKLEDQDQDWKETVNERHAQYTNLPPRHYRFRVIACNNSGLWNETGDTLEFSIAPALYQKNWFLTLCAAAFLAMLWMGYQLRIRRLQREFKAASDARLNERMRIARELHDTLLQSFQGLMFSFQAACNLLPGRTEDAIRTLKDAILNGDEAIAEGRDAIQGLRANPPLESNLEHVLRTAGEEFAKASTRQGEPPAFRVTVEGVRQPLSPLVQDDVHRIAREILRNAFRHAHANRIEAEIAYDSQFFRLRIRDDGKGIDRKVLEAGAHPGHWGLTGVRERAKGIGARLEVWSESGAGTEAGLTVPARIAYESGRRRKRTRLFRRSKVES